MPKTGAIQPILWRFLTASAFCILLDAALMEALAAGGIQLHLARLSSVAVATLCMAYGGGRYVLGGDPNFYTKKKQPIPFSVFAIAGALLGYFIFVRLTALMPQPITSIGRVLALAVGMGFTTFCNFAIIHSLLPVAEGQKKPPPVIKPRTFQQILIWGLFIVLAFGSSRIIGHLQDVNSFPDLTAPLGPNSGPDTWLRLTQIREWLSGGGFFDHTVRGTNAPEGGIKIHWTRPMDALVAFVYYFTPSRLGIDVRLMLAAAWLPAALCLATVAALGSAAGRHFRHVQVLGCAAVLLLVGVYRYVSPGDVDHHGLLAVLWCCVMSLLLARQLSASKSLLMGGILGLMLWISQESLIIAAVIYAIAGFEALYNVQKRGVLFFTALGAALVATAGLFVEMPAHEILTTVVYDTLSIVTVALLWLSAAGIGVLCLFLRPNIPYGARFFAAAVLGAGVLLAQHYFYPKFFLGPMVDVDPFIFTGFLPRIIEAQSLVGADSSLILRVLMPPGLAAFLICVALSKGKMRAEKKRFLLILGVLMCFTLLLTVDQIRWGYYLQTVSLTAVAALLPGMATAARGDTGKWLRDVPRFLRAYIVLCCMFLAMSLLARESINVNARKLCEAQLHFVIHTGQLQKLVGEKQQNGKQHILYTQQDQGGEVLFFTPFRIIASNYHREGKGLRDLSLIEKARTPEEARPLLKARQVDTLFFCTKHYDEGTWMRDLEKKKPPAWLTPVKGLKLLDLKEGDKPMLFRVKK